MADAKQPKRPSLGEYENQVWPNIQGHPGSPTTIELKQMTADYTKKYGKPTSRGGK